MSLEAMTLVVWLGSSTSNAAVLPLTVRVFATKALKLKTNALVHVLRGEEVSELWVSANLFERPVSIFDLSDTCSIVSF